VAQTTNDLVPVHLYLAENKELNQKQFELSGTFSDPKNQ
jgi:hypothetical protein